MNKNPLDLGKLLLDIGGLDKNPVDRGLTVRARGDFKVVNIGNNGMFASIELSDAERKDLREALAPDSLEEQAAELIDTLFRIANKMSSGEKVLIDAIGEAMHRQHRTLIQKFWLVIAQAVAAYAAMPDNFTDLRNTDSHEWAKKVAKIESHMRYI